jgi:putative endopeptidase
MDLVENIRAAFAEHIEHLDWMSDSTKARALDKLNAMKAMIGYPDEWKDYSSIVVSSDSLIGNLKRIGRWYYRFEMDKLHKPEDRSEWRMTATTLNAYYRASSNNITVPAVAFVPPFYFTHGDDAVNYGAIGTVIGHEMTHGFDDRGSQYDLLGSLRNWWSAGDRDRFNERAARIVRQYNQYTILDTVHINGRLTEGENIADLGGESIAYTAFQNTAEAHKDTLIDGLTPNQRFFMATAQQMRNKARPQILLTQVLTDPHSPWEYRLNGPLSNMVSFYMAFKVKPEDKMYRADSVRVKIW